MPTIKSLTFSSGGHHATCGARRKYLEADDRHLGREVLNIADAERWDAEMDRTRDTYHLRGTVTYREFILSPDPKDKPTLGQMKDLAVAWARENFGDAEACIVFHDDSKERIHDGEEGILHAHVVVNSVNLATGKKVTLSNADIRDLHNSAQRIARDLGLSEMPLYKPSKRLISDQAQQKTRTERQLEMRGIKPWKASVRDMAIQALDIAATPQEFSECLDKSDIDIIVEKDRVYLADRDNPTLACRADRLAPQLHTQAIWERIAKNAIELNGKYELELLARDIGKELAQGDEMRQQMQQYDKRCRKALNDYRIQAKELTGLPTTCFPVFSMPEPACAADIIRRNQIQEQFKDAAWKYMTTYGDYIPPEVKLTPAQRAAANQNNQQHSHSISSPSRQVQQSTPSHSRAR